MYIRMDGRMEGWVNGMMKWEVIGRKVGHWGWCVSEVSIYTYIHTTGRGSSVGGFSFRWRIFKSE